MALHDLSPAALALTLFAASTHAGPVAPVASFQGLGLHDAEHTDPRNGNARSTVASPNIGPRGQTAGHSSRYTATGGDNGQTSWLFDGETLWRIGLTDAQHTAGTYRSSIVKHMNRHGVVGGVSLRFDARGRDLGQSAWVSDGPNTVRLGYTGPEHTQPTTGYQISGVFRVYDNGWVLGYSTRYGPGGGAVGQTAWLSDGREITPLRGDFPLPQAYNDRGDIAGNAFLETGSGVDFSYAWRWRHGVITTLGLRDGEHVHPVDGNSRSVMGGMNARGRVFGTATRWLPGGDWGGDSAWMFDGRTVVRIGLRGPAHDRADGHHASYGKAMNDRGQVMGTTNRWDARGEYIGLAAWRATNGHTVRVGPHDAQHTNRRDKFQAAKPLFINTRGAIAGTADRFRPYGGRSAWLDVNATVHMIGMQDADHTDPDYHNQWSDVTALNAAGQVIGTSQRYLPAPGHTAWFYDPATRTTTPIEADGRPLSAQLLDDTGRVSGIFDKPLPDGGTRPWMFTWTVAEGARTLGPAQLRVDGDLVPVALSGLEVVTPDGLVRGTATFAGGTMSAPFILRPLPR
jgi:hypothetical protein